MQSTKKQSKACQVSCVLLLVHLAGCATRTPTDVGRVVVAPQVQLPAPPLIIQQTSPKPVGYFQQTLADYFNALPARLTTSTQPMPVAEQTPTQ